MFGSPRIGLKPLAALCRRLSHSLAAGIDVRRVWARELDRATGNAHRNVSHVAQAVNTGSPMSEALDECGDYFPELFRGMMHVGEKSGNHAEILRDLADQYDHQLELRRTFVSAIWWPLTQLTLAIGVIGLLILVMGMLPARPGSPPIDILGLGLFGMEGLVIYLLVVGGIALAVALTVRAILRGALWVRPVQRMILRVPKLGRAFETLALARLAWAMHITFGAGMELKEALRLSLRASRNAEYADTADAAWASIRGGSDLHDALASTAHYPRDFLDIIEVGEQSGRLPEALGKLANQYEDETRSAMAILTKALGFLVWLMVALIIIMMIFRIAGFYIGVLNEATRM
jgi:type IV pilus assembly protein PilC